MEEEFVGAIKIKDGLFIGDEYAAQDFEFVVTNKVTHIINCAGKQIPNYWETVGVMYLTYDWQDSENQVVFDTKGEIVNEIYNFIEDAARLGEGVLVHSVKGQSRSCCVLTAYFMKRYRWSLYKTLEYLTSRRSDLEIRTSFYHQLLSLESRIFQQEEGNVTVNWFELGPDNDREEMLLRNTFLNARSAPFDETLVNPQAVVEGPRTIGWVDEKLHSKASLTSHLGKESVASRLAKPVMTTVKSILKGSNKVFSLKPKNFEEEEPASSSSKGNVSPGLRLNKSVRNFSEGRNSASLTEEVNGKVAGEKGNAAGEKSQDSGKGGKGPNMLRSSSATYLEKEENSRPSSSKTSFSNNDKTTANTNSAAKVANVNGNIIHLTVNNYLGPINNQTTNNTVPLTNIDNEPAKPKQVSINTKAIDWRPPLAPNMKSGLSSETKLEEGDSEKQVELIGESSNNVQRNEKSALSTNYLKSQIEKKLSKEYKSQLPSSLARGDVQPVTVKTPNGTEKKGTQAFKEYAKPSDLKVNYQALLKNRETPPPRKREEAKKVLESPGKKAASKSSLSKTTTDSGMPYSSYLNNLFSTSFSQLNTITPSYNTPGDKKTPISAKSTQMTYNLTLAQKAQALSRPQRANNPNQLGDKGYNSSLGSTSKISTTGEPSSATLVGNRYSNYTTVSNSKTNPVRVTYDKVDRPHSATPDRSATPQAGQKRPGTSGAGFGSKTSDQRSSAPIKSNNTSKHVKKDSGSTQDLMAKYRQRSSSPSTMGYNPALSSSGLSKSRGKY